MVVLLDRLLGYVGGRTMSVIQRYVVDRDIITGMDERRSIERVHSYADTSYNEQLRFASIDFVEEIGSLVINFGIRGNNIEVLESDALALITIADGKIADIELLLNNKDVIKKLSKIFKPYSDRE